MKKKLIGSLSLIFFVLLTDQVLKIWVKTHMEYRDSIPLIGDWFLLHFIENNGFAFGTEVGGEYGKLGLTLFRLLAVSVIGYYLRSLIIDQKRKFRMGYILMVSLILAGAVGNIIDSVFYGLVFSESPLHGGYASFLPAEGYAGLFHGKVVDMLYFPIIQTYLPDWVPFIGGQYFEFFKPIFNLADSAISVGVVGIILFYRRELKSFS